MILECAPRAEPPVPRLRMSTTRSWWKSVPRLPLQWHLLPLLALPWSRSVVEAQDAMVALAPLQRKRKMTELH
jgi:hypothetical protein